MNEWWMFIFGVITGMVFTLFGFCAFIKRFDYECEIRELHDEQNSKIQNTSGRPGDKVGELVDKKGTGIHWEYKDSI